MAPDKTSFQGDEVLYGTADGKIGLVQLNRQGPHTHWLLEPEMAAMNGGATSGAVQVLKPMTLRKSIFHLALKLGPENRFLSHLLLLLYPQLLLPCVLEYTKQTLTLTLFYPSSLMRQL